jgi:hypothetical protein
MKIYVVFLGREYLLRPRMAQVCKPIIQQRTLNRRRGRRERGQHNAGPHRDGHGEAEASCARVPAPGEGSRAAGDTAVASTLAPVPVLRGGDGLPRPPKDSTFRSAGAARSPATSPWDRFGG